MTESQPNAFDPDHLFPSLLIQLTRVYDVGIAILRNMNKDEADALVEFHEHGGFLSPPPSYTLEDEDGEIEE